MRISFPARLAFFARGRVDKRAGWSCPYTPNSKEAYWWGRGFAGKKPPVNPLVYMAKANQSGFEPLPTA